MTAAHQRVAVVTGASAGIGAATAQVLHEQGWSLVLGARRLEALNKIAEPLGAQALSLDVTDEASVKAFAAAVPRVDLVVANAGFAIGLSTVAESSAEDWRAMYETNVLGVLRTARAFLPALHAAPYGRLVIVGSTSSFEVYRGGGGYTATKHALRAVIRTLRLELLGTTVGISEVDPGLVETEFSRVRFDGDRDRAAAVYKGMRPLTGRDIAECIAFAASRPAHANVDELVMRPHDQATTAEIARRTLDSQED